MSKFHLNRETGKVGACHAGEGANPRSCPLGGATGTENHYESAAEAQDAYESSMADKAVPSTSSSTKPVGQMNQTELTRFAKKTIIMESQMKVVNSGNERVLAAFAENDNAHEEPLALAYSLAKKPSTRRALALQNRFPVGDLDAADMKAKYDQLPHGRSAVNSYARSNAVNDRSAEALMNAGIYGHLTDFDNEISIDVRRKLIVKAPNHVARLAANTELSSPRNMRMLPTRTIVGMVGALKDPEEIEFAQDKVLLVGSDHDVELMNDYLVENRNTPNSIISDLGDSMYRFDRIGGRHDDSKGDQALAIYRHPNADENTKSKLAHFDLVGRVRRLDQMKATSPKVFASLDHPKEREDGPLEPNRRRVSLNPDAVAKLGMSKNDVDTYVRAFVNHRLTDTVYNPKTGEYTGYGA